MAVKIPGVSSDFHPVEITGITSRWNIPECATVPSGGICVTVPPYSYGYFKSKIKLINFREETFISNINVNDIELYPNPATSIFAIHLSSAEEKTHYNVMINDLMGHTIRQVQVQSDQLIEISGLTSGIYTVLIFLTNNQQIIKSLVKI